MESTEPDASANGAVGVRKHVDGEVEATTEPTRTTRSVSKADVVLGWPIIQRSAHHQGHARETFSFNHGYGATAGTKFVGLVASAIASNGECLELTPHREILVCYRQDLYGRPIRFAFDNPGSGRSKLPQDHLMLSTEHPPQRHPPVI